MGSPVHCSERPSAPAHGSTPVGQRVVQLWRNAWLVAVAESRHPAIDALPDSAAPDFAVKFVFREELLGQ